MSEKIITKSETVVTQKKQNEPTIKVYINLANEKDASPEQQKAIAEMREIFADYLEEKCEL